MSKTDTICVIDDDPISIFGFKKTMRELDLSNEVLVYKNGSEAINGLKIRLDEGEKLPSIIFLDLNMPIMDGWDFLEDFVKISNHERNHVHIYILSSSVDTRDLQKAKEFSAVVNNYFIKPITAKDLLKTIINPA